MADHGGTGPVVVLGPNGQIGSELVALDWPTGFDVVAAGRDTVDLANTEAVASALSALSPATVINAAAYTAVDRAESEPGLAYTVNAAGVEALADACDDIGARLIHISTDYVFDGTKGEPYTVEDTTSPLGVYGRSKLAGELACLARPGTTVVRTAWVYSQTGSNFVKTIRRLAQEREQLGVVDDQLGNPSSASDIAAAIQAVALDPQPFEGIVHAVAPDAATWYELASAIVADLGAAASATVNPITTAEYPTAADRPADSRLDTTLLAERFGHKLRPWRAALHDVCRALDRAEAQT